MIIKGTGGLGNMKTNGDHPNYNIIENGQNTEKTPGERLAVTQTQVKNHQLKLMRKTLKEQIIIMIIQEDKIKVKLIREILTEKKTKIPSLGKTKTKR